MGLKSDLSLCLRSLNIRGNSLASVMGLCTITGFIKECSSKVYMSMAAAAFLMESADYTFRFSDTSSCTSLMLLVFAILIKLCVSSLTYVSYLSVMFPSMKVVWSLALSIFTFGVRISCSMPGETSGLVISFSYTGVVGLLIIE